VFIERQTNHTKIKGRLFRYLGLIVGIILIIFPIVTMGWSDDLEETTATTIPVINESQIIVLPTLAAETETTIAESTEIETSDIGKTTISIKIESKIVGKGTTESSSVIETESMEVEDTEDSTDDDSQDTDLEYIGDYYITGYGYGDCCNGGGNGGKTASGASLKPWHTVAMKGISFGTKIYIEGLGEFSVEDRGVGSGVIDVCVNTCEHTSGSNCEAYSITGHYKVYIVH